MRRIGWIALVLGLAAHAHAQNAVVLTIDTGELRINVPALTSAIQTALSRPVVRMTDEQARNARGRLTIAYQTPNRWVLRYEASGAVAWVTDRIIHPGEMRSRLAALSQQLVGQVEHPNSNGAQSPRGPSSNPDDWADDSVILALQNEIVDPFAGEPARPLRPVAILWSEVVDPFADRPPRAASSEVWSEVLDPWALPRRH